MSAGPDGVRLWEVATGRERLRLGGAGGLHYAVAFRPDGRTFAASDGHNAVRIWNTLALSGPAEEASPDRLEAWWVDLAGDDAPAAYRALCELAHRPAQAVPLLRRRLTDAFQHDPKRVARIGPERTCDRNVARAGGAAPAGGRSRGKRGGLGESIAGLAPAVKCGFAGGARLGRAVYHLWHKGEAFDRTRFLAS